MKKLGLCLLLGVSSSLYALEGYFPTENEQKALTTLLKEDIAVSFQEGGVTFCSKDKVGFCPKLDTVSVDELQKVYSDNEFRGDKKFKGKQFIVNGTVGAIQSGFGDQPFVVFKSKGFNATQAKFADIDLEKLIDLNKGQKLTAICIGNGEVAGSPMLNECRFPDSLAKEYEEKALAEYEQLKNGNVEVSKYVRAISYEVNLMKQASNDFKQCKGKIASQCLDKIFNLTSEMENKILLDYFKLKPKTE